MLQSTKLEILNSFAHVMQPFLLFISLPTLGCPRLGSGWLQIVSWMIVFVVPLSLSLSLVSWVANIQGRRAGNFILRFSMVRESASLQGHTADALRVGIFGDIDNEWDVGSWIKDHSSLIVVLYHILSNILYSDHFAAGIIWVLTLSSLELSTKMTTKAWKGLNDLIAQEMDWEQLI